MRKEGSTASGHRPKAYDAGAAMYTAAVEPGSTCVVFGAGMVGLWGGGRMPGSRVLSGLCAWTPPSERLNLARGQGATDCWQADEHTVGSGYWRRQEASARTTPLRRPDWSR